MFSWLSDTFSTSGFMPHGHCYLWKPALLWLHFWSDLLIGLAYLGISLVLAILVRRLRLPFSPVFIAFGLFIALCGGTHFMEVWTIWQPDYWASGVVKAATAAASVATAVGLLYVKPQVEEVTHAARLSEERRLRLETTNAELETLYTRVKELDETKSQLFANVSHELRTPLALILGPVERLLGDNATTPAQRRQLESIERNGRLLLKHVNDLLDVARLEAGEAPYHPEPVDLAAVVRGVASQFEVAAEQRDIDYRVTLPEALPTRADPDQMERVLANLLSNAFKFTPDGGTIRLGLERQDNGAVLTVADSGPGVPAEQRQRIFERFRQGDGGATRRHGGTGLGLAIVQAFVDLHGGRVDVHDAPEGGALFRIALPGATAPEAPVDAAPSQTAERPRQHDTVQGAVVEVAGDVSTDDTVPTTEPGRAAVLVVEDNHEMRAFVASTLAQDYNVFTAADGRAGLQQAEALRPDVIVTDIMMPGMSGDQLVRALRAQRDFDPVPILLLSARSDDALRVELLRAGAQDYLTKPFLAEELQARTANLAALKRSGDTLRHALDSLSTDLESLAQELAARNRQLDAARAAAETARDEAERASRVKSHFLGLISHELRTPLTTIHMNLQLLGRGRTEALPPGLQPRVDRMVQAARQLSELLEGLLEYTRLETGHLTVRHEPVDLAALARDVTEEHRSGVSADVRIEFHPPDRPFDLIRGDPHLLRVILGNLLSNAIKFTPAGAIRVAVDATSDGYTLAVHDTGIGIPEADLERVFQPFEQLEPLERKSVPGAGLGLTLVKQIVDALQGRIDVSSEVGVGTTFRVHLPT